MYSDWVVNNNNKNLPTSPPEKGKKKGPEGPKTIFHISGSK